MTETKAGAYDDAPESRVSTFLQVPLLWRQNGRASGRSTQSSGGAKHRLSNGGRRSSGAGRHRAPDAPVVPSPTHAPTRPPAASELPPPPVTEAIAPDAITTVAAPRARSTAAVPVRPSVAALRREALGHTVRVGLISAAIVLAVFVGVLFLLGRLLP